MFYTLELRDDEGGGYFYGDFGVKVESLPFGKILM